MPMLKIAFLFTDWYQVYSISFYIVFENMIECVVTYYLVNI